MRLERARGLGLGLGPHPATGQTPVLDEGDDCRSRSRRGRKRGRRGGAAACASNPILWNAPGPDAPPARARRPSPGRSTAPVTGDGLRKLHPHQPLGPKRRGLCRQEPHPPRGVPSARARPSAPGPLRFIPFGFLLNFIPLGLCVLLSRF